MSDAVTTAETTDKPANANPEAAKYRKRASELKARVAELESKLVDLEGERDNAVKALKDAPGEALAKIAELEGRIRHRTHRDAFDKLAAGKIKNEALEDAYALSGWKVESDDVDENTMGEVITSLVEAKPYLRVEQAQSEPAETGESAPAVRSYSLTGHKPKPVTGAGRGPAPESTPKHSKTVYRL